jgi:hypothetical protein
MLKKTRLFAGLCLAALVFAGCQQPTGAPPLPYEGDITALVGVWDSFADSFVINSTTISYDDGTDGAWGANYTGTIRHIVNIDYNNGVIIIEFTTAPSSPYTASNNFLGIYFQVQTASMVKFANSYKPSLSTASLAEAIDAFSMDKINDYLFGGWSSVSPQFKQPVAVFDPGFLQGNWTGTDDWGWGLDPIVRITPTTVTVYLGYVSSITIAYAGTIKEITDVTQSSGYIYFKIVEEGVLGAMEGDCYEGDYYALHWKDKNGAGTEVKFSVWNEYDSIANLDTLKGLGDFLDDPGYETFNK